MRLRSQKARRAERPRPGFGIGGGRGPVSYSSGRRGAVRRAAPGRTAPKPQGPRTLADSKPWTRASRRGSVGIVASSMWSSGPFPI
eukprot:5150371-Alexandrium_andersonii.AAC.2